MKVVQEKMWLNKSDGALHRWDKECMGSKAARYVLKSRERSKQEKTDKDWTILLSYGSRFD